MLRIAVGDVVTPFTEVELVELDAIGVSAEFYNEDPHVIVMDVPDHMCDNKPVNLLRPAHPNIRRRRDIRA